MAMSSDVKYRLLVALCIVAAAFIAYANSFHNGFVWDDASSVLLHEDVKNARLADLFTKDQHAYGRGQGNFYRPLVSLSFAIDYALTTRGQQPPLNQFGVPDIGTFYFHFTNTAWHALAGVFLFLILARLGAPRLVQVCVPLLYVIHPLHTEAVTYISGRADPMAAAFGFAGMLFAVRSTEGARNLLNAAAGTLCFALALLCKESALIFPFLALVILLLVRKGTSAESSDEPRRSPISVLAGAGLVLVVYGMLRATVLHFASDSTTGDRGLGARLLETLQAFALYVKLIFVPTNLHMERTLNGVGALTAIVGALLLIVCLGAGFWAYRTGKTRLAAAVCWFVLTWIPISGIFPLNAPMAEHWMYVPLAGFLWAFFEVLALGLQGRGPRTVLVVATYAAALCLVALTASRNLDWRSDETLYRATLEMNPGSIRVTYNLAVTYEDLLDNLPGARRNYERVIALYKEKKAAEDGPGPERFWDDELESHLSLGRIFMEQQRFDRAAQHFATLLQVGPTESTRPLLHSAAMGMVQSALAMGRTADAKQIVEQLRDKFPEISNQLNSLVQGIPA